MKNFILILTFISIHFSSFSQTQTQIRKEKQSAGQHLDHFIDDAEEAIHKIKYGAKGAVSFTTITNIKDSKSVVGFDAGVFGRIPVVRSVGFFIQPEVLLSRKGFKPENQDSVTNLYVDVPLMFGFSPEVFSGFFLEVGPKLGFAINKGNYTDLSSEKQKSKSFDFALAFGAGFDFGKYLKIPGGLSLIGRYNLGLTNVYDLETSTTKAKEASNKNSSFSVGLAYNF